MKTFVEAYWDQEAVEEDIDNWVEMWHLSGDSVTLNLHEYLGLTWQDYSKWVAGSESLIDILHSGIYNPNEPSCASAYYEPFKDNLYRLYKEGGITIPESIESAAMFVRWARSKGRESVETPKPSESPIPLVYLVLDNKGEVVSNLGTKNKIYTKKGNAESLCKRHKGAKIVAYKLVEVPTVK